MLRFAIDFRIVSRNAPMNTPAISPTLGKAYALLLDSMTSDEVRTVLSASTEREYPANKVVTTQGMPATTMFLLMSGSARYFFITPDGAKILLKWLVPGEFFGGAALLGSPSHYVVSCETLKASRIRQWDQATIDSLTERYPVLFRNALRCALEYLGMYTASRVALTCHDARERVAQTLNTLASTIGRPVNDGLELEVTNEELANAANVTLFTASRLMSEWQRAGAIAKKRGRVILLSADRLLEAPQEEFARIG